MRTQAPPKQSSKVGFELVRMGFAFTMGSIFPFGGLLGSSLFKSAFQPKSEPLVSSVPTGYTAVALSDDEVMHLAGSGVEVNESGNGVYLIPDEEMDFAEELVLDFGDPMTGTYAGSGMIEEEAYAESLGDFGVDAWI